MRKLFFNAFAIAILATIVVSCDRLGLNNAAMDSEEVATKVKDAVAKNVDATKWKIYEIAWHEGVSLDNKLQLISLTLVNKENDYFTQNIRLNNKSEFVGDEIKEPTIPKTARGKVVYDEVVGIDCNKLDGPFIVKQIETVKALIPAEYEFESVESYSIKEAVHKTDFTSKAMNMAKEKEEKQYGKQTSNIALNVLKKGEKTKMEGRHITKNYYTINFYMKEGGNWEIEE